jgi:hypothetical protein
MFVPESFSSRPFWVAVLGRWLGSLKEYEAIDASDRDLACWYGERPLTGLLGAAAWQLGGWSLEEFCADRRKKHSDETCHGRGDLWLGSNRSDTSGAATVEAKVLWAYQNSLDAVRTGLNDQLKQARKQLRQIKPTDRVGQPFAVCYVVPCYAGPESKQRGERLLTWLAEQTQKEGMANATHLATIGDITDFEDKDRRMYPGVLLVARQEQWQDE